MRVNGARIAVLCFLTASCSGPSAPSTVQTVPIADVRYEHVVDFQLDSTMQIGLEFSDCTKFGELSGLAGPDVCNLVKDQGGHFVCPVSGFMARVSTQCDNFIDVMIRSSTGNPLFQTGHNIYLNETLVTRLTGSTVPTATDIARETGRFQVTSTGKIY